MSQVGLLALGLILISYVNCQLKWDQHHNNEELYSTLKIINQQCPSITHLYNLEFGNLEKTVLGNKLWVLAFGKSPNVTHTYIPEFKYIGNIHGNEVVGRELLLRFASELCLGYINGNEKIHWIINNTRIHILPAMNPDGHQLATGEEKHNIKGRTNANNVDLNRNFPDLNRIYFDNKAKGFEKLDHLLTEKVLAQYQLETETWLMINWIMTNNFVLSATMHGGDLVANYPFDTSPHHERRYTKCADDETFVQLANAYSFDNHRMYEGQKQCYDSINHFIHGRTNGAQWYPIDGGMQDFNYLASNCFEITLELGCEKYPDGKDLEKYWQWNNRSLYDFMLQVHGGVKGVVLGEYESSGDLIPLEGAQIRVSKIVEDTVVPIEHNVLTSSQGDFYRLLTPGTYIIYAVKESYEPAMACMTIDSVPSLNNLREADLINFVLKKADNSRINDPDLIFEMVQQHLRGPFRLSGAGDDQLCHQLSNDNMFTEFQA